MKHSATIVLLAAVVVAFSSCRKDGNAEPQDAGYDYFPIKVGSWIDYQVDSVWRDDNFNVHDSTSYLLRQVVAENYTDPGGRPSQRIERFTLINGEWVIRDVWTATRSATALEMTEENVRRLKISFPVREARTWDVNIYNAEQELMVAARDVDEAYDLEGQTFTRTMAVRSTVAGNPIRTRDLEERYAHGIGMIEHHWFYREAPNFDLDAPVQSVRYHMVMVAHGN